MIVNSHYADTERIFNSSVCICPELYIPSEISDNNVKQIVINISRIPNTFLSGTIQQERIITQVLRIIWLSNNVKIIQTQSFLLNNKPRCKISPSKLFLPSFSKQELLKTILSSYYLFSKTTRLPKPVISFFIISSHQLIIY